MTQLCQSDYGNAGWFDARNTADSAGLFSYKESQPIAPINGPSLQIMRRILLLFQAEVLGMSRIICSHLSSVLEDV